MDKFVIRRRRPLLGTIRVSGAKNAAASLHGCRPAHRRTVILEKFPSARHSDHAQPASRPWSAEVELGYGRAQHPHHHPLRHWPLPNLV